MAAKKFTAKQTILFLVVLVGLTATAGLLQDKKQEKQGSEQPDMCGSTPCPDWDAVAAKERAKAAAAAAPEYRLENDCEVSFNPAGCEAAKRQRTQLLTRACHKYRRADLVEQCLREYIGPNGEPLK